MLFTMYQCRILSYTVIFYIQVCILRGVASNFVGHVYIIKQPLHIFNLEDSSKLYLHTLTDKSSGPTSPNLLRHSKPPQQPCHPRLPFISCSSWSNLSAFQPAATCSLHRSTSQFISLRPSSFISPSASRPRREDLYFLIILPILSSSIMLSSTFSAKGYVPKKMYIDLCQ